VRSGGQVAAVHHEPLDAASLASIVRALVDRDRGFTVDLRCGRPVPDGLAVCADPDLALRVDPADWDQAQVAGWIEACRATAEGRSDLHLGGWHPRRDDAIHLDLVRVLPAERRTTARRLGVRHRQRALFDLGAGSLVPLELST
jgi:hypothetical protein